MIKSKIDFNAFDKKNSKVANLDPSTVKNKSKAGVKKMAGKQEMRVPFHLVLGYFVDDAGKMLGHFLDFGENKKMSKHFEQVEMKTGKMDKSMSDSPKKASKGEAYVKEINGKKVVHIEPHKDSKIPKGQWAKILKSLRPLLNGMKAVAVIGGEIVEDAKDKDDAPDNNPVDKKPKKSVEEKVKKLFSEITEGLKNQLPTVIPNIKQKKVSQKDMDISSDLWDKIEKLKELYESSNDEIKNKMSKGYTAILKQAPKVDKIQKAVEALLGITDDPAATTVSNDTDSEEAKALKELLAYMEHGIQSFDKEFSTMKDDLKKTSSAVIASGRDLLKSLF